MRLRGIGPEVLLLCFLVVGVAAFVLGRRSVRARRVRGDTEYFAGLFGPERLGIGRGNRDTETLSLKIFESESGVFQRQTHRP